MYFTLRQQSLAYIQGLIACINFTLAVPCFWVPGHCGAFSSRPLAVQGSRFFIICHIHNHTGYNRQWNVNQDRSAQWKVQKNKIKIKHNNNIKAIKTMKQNTREYIYIYTNTRSQVTGAIIHPSTQVWIFMLVYLAMKYLQVSVLLLKKKKKNTISILQFKLKLKSCVI